MYIFNQGRRSTIWQVVWYRICPSTY